MESRSRGKRDEVEMFAFHCDVPAGVSQLEVTFDDVSQPATTMSARLARIKWNRLLLYPRGMSSDSIRVAASNQVAGRLEVCDPAGGVRRAA